MKATSIRLMKNSPSAQALMRKTPEATKATPAARPSMLSRRLKALVTPTSQTSVTRTLRASLGMNDVRTPAATSMTAAASWPAALTATGKRLPSTSSARPMPKVRAPPARMPKRRALTR